MAEPTDPPPHYVGHRQRLRKRFLAAGGNALEDHELLEMLLTLAIPRRDVKPLAKTLLARFGGFAGVLCADRQTLENIDGIGESAAATLALVHESAIRLKRAGVANQPILSSWQALLDYCHTSLAHTSVERMHILYLNRKNMLICDEEQQKGTIDQTQAYPREIIRRALELSAAALILVHNHPSGDPAPSQSDIDFTKRLNTVAQAMGIVLHDHLIIGKNDHFSFRTNGAL